MGLETAFCEIYDEQCDYITAWNYLRSGACVMEKPPPSDCDYF